MPRTSRPLSIFPIVLRDVRVTAIEDLTPHMRRLTLAGEDLLGGTRDGHAFGPFRSDGFDDHVKLVLPDADGRIPHVGTQDGERFDWMPGVLSATRDYTVRRVAPDGASFEVDVVRHDSGLASDWAFSCEIGSPVAFAGPKSSARVNHEVDWHLLMGDETAMPAIERWLEEAPDATRARVFIEVPAAEDQRELATAADAEITYLVRGGIPAGHSPLLLEALTAWTPPAGRGYLWCAGETLTIAPIRRHLRRELGFDAQDVEVNGYWRRMSTPAPAEPGTETEAAAGPSPIELQIRLHEMGELLGPIALRTAVTLGIPARLATEPMAPARLAEEIGVPPARLSPFLDALIALELVDVTDTALELTSLGEALLEEGAPEDLDLSQPLNRAELALVDLPEILRTGAPGPSRVIPDLLDAWRAADPEADAAAEARAEDSLQWSLQALGALAEVSSAAELTLVGDGLVASAIALLSAFPERRVHVVVPPHGLDTATGRLDAALPAAVRGQVDVSALDAEGTDALPACDVLVDQLGLDALDDAAARARCAAYARAARHGVVVVTDLADDARTDDHVAAASLTALATRGTPLRTSAATIALLEDAGAGSARAEPLGWGFGPAVVIAASAPAASHP